MKLSDLKRKVILVRDLDEYTIERITEQEVGVDVPGAFVGVRFSDETVKGLTEFVGDIDLKNPVGPDKLHCTVMYTTTDAPELLDIEGEAFDPPITGTPDKFEIFNSNDDHDCLVLRIVCDELTERHEEIKTEYGVKYTHSEYKPHITLSYNCDGLDLDAVNEKKYDGPIEIVEEYVTPLDPEWV